MVSLFTYQDLEMDLRIQMASYLLSSLNQNDLPALFYVFRAMPLHKKEFHCEQLPLYRWIQSAVTSSSQVIMSRTIYYEAQPIKNFTKFRIIIKPQKSCRHRIVRGPMKPSSYNNVILSGLDFRQLSRGEVEAIGRKV